MTLPVYAWPVWRVRVEGRKVTIAFHDGFADEPHAAVTFRVPVKATIRARRLLSADVMRCLDERIVDERRAYRDARI